MDTVALLVALAIVAVFTVDAAVREVRAARAARVAPQDGCRIGRLLHVRLVPPPTGVEVLVDRCRVCGCTDDEACPGGCWWVIDPRGLGPLCSACVGRVA